jgi:hypothetical protein
LRLSKNYVITMPVRTPMCQSFFENIKIPEPCYCGVPPGGLPFLFRQEREERSRVKGVAERSESSNIMIAGGNHTLTIATSKCIPLDNPPPLLRECFGNSHIETRDLSRTAGVRCIAYCTPVSMYLESVFYHTATIQLQQKIYAAPS